MLIVRSANLFNYINLTQPDVSGMLRFLTDELQDAEDKGERGMCHYRPFLRLLTFSTTSLDYRSRFEWMGWNRSPRNTNQSMWVLCIYSISS
jgi:hypothetical protein